ncbi:AAA ATPase-like domain-containing protein [Desulfonema limicola]|uniref:AAA ATPase-like domain-containing protein n=1 Tax=Desulfonema limicola TaxID=45656 RepID=A0A975B399_9BACT|nr:AAA family ATPase [Desulfonema limicola]QTA77976.1 AAA ATPase-like domain-containing protein [Desulfonema limicola]
MKRPVPYGIADYEELVRDNCYFVDKTQYIEIVPKQIFCNKIWQEVYIPSGTFDNRPAIYCRLKCLELQYLTLYKKSY